MSAYDPVADARRLIGDRSLCPGCHAPLAGPACLRCGLDLSGPQADEVWFATVAAVEALDRRQEHLSALYGDAARRAGQRLAWLPSTEPPAPSPDAPPAPPLSSTSPAAPAPAAAPAAPATPSPATAPAAPAAGVPAAPVLAVPAIPAQPAALAAPAAGRTWRVQTVLQLLGAGLLAAAGVVFLVFAWGSFSLGARAAVIGVATVLVFAAASLLRRRGLPQGAEAVAVLAVVLLLLDAWAVRRTGLVGGGPGWAYWAVALAACAAVLAAWGRPSRLTTGPVAAAVLWLAAPVPLSAWRPGPTTGGWVALLVVAAAAVRFAPARAVEPAPWRRRGRLVLTCGAALAWAVAAAWALATAAIGETAWAATGQLAALAGTAAATALLARRVGVGGRDEPAAPWAAAAGAAAAACVAAATAQGALATGAGPVTCLGAAAATASLLAAAAAFAARGELVDRAAAGVAGVAGALVVAAAVAVAGTASAVVAGSSSALRPLAATGGAVAAGALAAGLLGARRGRAHAWRVCAGLAVTAAVALTLAAGATGPRPWLPALPLLALAAAGATADRLLSAPVEAEAAVSARWWRGGARAGSAAAGLLALATAVPDRAAVGVCLAALGALAVSARGWRADAAPLGTCLGSVLATAGAAFLLAAAGAGGGDAVATASAAGALALGAVALVVPRVAAPERAAAHGTAAVTAAVGWTAGVATGASATVAAAAAALLLLAATIWRGTARLDPARLDPARLGPVQLGPATAAAAVAAAAPVAALVAPTLRATLWPQLPPTGAVLVAAALGAASVLLAPWAAELVDPSARAAAEGGGAATLVGALVTAWSAGPEVAALVLLVAAVAALGAARAADRRPLRWVALGLAVAASWTLLGARDVTVAEAYLAPAGAVLAAVGARRARRGADGAAGVLGGGLGLALLPSALLPGAIPLGDLRLDRAWVTCAAAVALAATALLAARRHDRSGASWHPVWLVAGGAAVLAALGPFRQAVAAAVGIPAAPGAAPELWAALAAAVLAAAAWVVAPGPQPEPGRWWPAALAPALVAGLVPSTLAAAPGAVGALRVAVPFAVAGAVAVVAARALLADAGERRGLPQAVGTAVALAALAAGVASARLDRVPGDVPLVVLGLLLLVLGIQWLLARPAIGTWPALVAGLVGTLAIPTFAGLADAAPWRPPYLVVAGVAAVACGAVLRWQAPFVVGGAALLVVVAAQLGPWAGTVLTAAGGWPLLAAGGLLLLGLGLTYERRLAQAREAVRFVAAMR